jgi:hypothetical protein
MSDFVAIPEPAEPVYPEAVKLIMPGEFAAGGIGSPENTQAEALVRRTQWLKRQVQILLETIPGTEEFEQVLNEIRNELAALDAVSLKNRIDHLERTSGTLALNLQDLAWRLELEGLYGSYDAWWLENFLSTNEIDLADVGVTSVVPGDDSLDVDDISNIVVGLNYTLTDGLVSEQVQVRATATAGTVKRVILVSPVTQQYRTGSARLMRTSVRISDGKAFGAGTTTSKGWNPNVTWQGTGALVPVDVPLETSVGNSGAFTVSGDIGFVGDLVTLA